MSCPQYDKHTLPVKAVTCRDGWEVQISVETLNLINAKAKYAELVINFHTDEKIDKKANGNPALTMSLTLTMLSSHSSTISMSLKGAQCSTKFPGQLKSLAN